jgi:hypothetical protein
MTGVEFKTAKMTAVWTASTHDCRNGSRLLGAALNDFYDGFDFFDTICPNQN